MVTVSVVCLPWRRTSICSLLPDLGSGYRAGQVLHRVDRLAGVGGDHIPDLDAGLGCRAVGLDARDESAVILVEAERVRHLRRDLLDLDAEPATGDAAAGLQTAHHRLGDISRNGEADTDAAAIGRVDRGIDADHLALLVEGRATRIAAIDRRVDLQEIVERSGMDVAAPGRDDAGRHRAAEAKRIACRDDPIADAHLIAVAELHGGKRMARLDLDHREIGTLIVSNQRKLGRQDGAVLQGHFDVGTILDHVIIGHDDARRIDDETGAERRQLLRPRLLLRLPLRHAELAEELLGMASRAGIAASAEWPAADCRRSAHLGRGDRHHGGQHLLDQRREAVGQRRGNGKKRRDGDGQAAAECKGAPTRAAPRTTNWRSTPDRVPGRD